MDTAGGGRGTRVLGLSGQGIRIFASASDAPRARRPSDTVKLVVFGGLAATISAGAAEPRQFETELHSTLEGIPDGLDWLWVVGHGLLVAWPVVLVILAVTGRRRWAVVRDLVLAGVVTVLLAALASRWAGEEWLSLTEELWRASGDPEYPALRLALAAATIAVAAPYLSRPLRYTGYAVLVAGTVSGLALGLTLVSGAVGALALGLTAAAIVHLAFGSPGGWPPVSQIEGALREFGVETVSLEPVSQTSDGVSLLAAETAAGEPLVVKVFGRDAMGGRLLTKAWRFLWYRDSGPSLTLSRLQQVEHEAFVTFFAERAGAAVPSVVIAGSTQKRDALLVVEGGGQALSALTPEARTDGLISGLWKNLARLHEVDVAAGTLDLHRLQLGADGAARLADLSTASVAAPRERLMVDRAQLLVATAVLIGPDRALRVAADSLGQDGLAETVPYTQTNALAPDVRQAADDQGLDLDDLREAVARRAGVDAPSIRPLTRVTWGRVIRTAIYGLGAYAIVVGLGGLDFASIVDELAEADWSRLVLALFVAQTPRLAEGVATLGATMRPLPLSPVLRLQFAITFINLAVPSTAARVAVNVRFFQQVGLSATESVTVGAIDSVAMFTVQILLLVVIVGLGLTQVEGFLGDLEAPDGGLLVILALVLVGAVIVGAVLFWRHRERIREVASEARQALRVLRSPSKLGLSLGGNLVAQILYAMTMGLVLSAFGESATLPELLLVNVMASLFAGLVPVPGGIGVTEAAITAGLIAVGVPESAAFATALMHRVVTFYAPPTFGFFAMRSLERDDYL